MNFVTQLNCRHDVMLEEGLKKAACFEMNLLYERIPNADCDQAFHLTASKCKRSERLQVARIWHVDVYFP